MARGAVRFPVKIPGLFRRLRRIESTMGVLVSAVDDVISRVETLTQTVATELGEVRALVLGGQQDETKLAEAATRLDSVITAVQEISDKAQLPAEPPVEPPVEP